MGARLLAPLGEIGCDELRVAMNRLVEIAGVPKSGRQSVIDFPCRHFIVTTRGEDVVVRLYSRILSEAAAVEIAIDLLEMIDRGECRCLILDLGQVERLTSTMLAKAVKLTKVLHAQGGTLRLTNLCPNVRQVFAVTKLDQVLEIAESRSLDPLGGTPTLSWHVHEA
jgi:anti-sigma B factor antagonist